MHAQQVFAPFIPAGETKNIHWVCLQQHLQYVMLLMQTSFSRDDIARLDQLIFSQQSLFLSIPHYFFLWKPKNHFAQHFPVDIIRFGPPLFYWCMKFEMRHQVYVFFAFVLQRSLFLHTFAFVSACQTHCSQLKLQRLGVHHIFSDGHDHRVGLQRRCTPEFQHYASSPHHN